MRNRKNCPAPVVSRYDVPEPCSTQCGNLQSRRERTTRADATAGLRRIRHEGQRQLTRDEIHQLVTRIGDPHELLRNADNDDKADLYGNLGLRLTYHPHNDEVRVEMTLDPDSLGYWCVSEVRVAH